MAQRNFAELTADELFADWVIVAERAYKESVDLHWNRRMFRTLAAVFNANPRLQEVGGHVWIWMRNNYIAGAAMAVRRELDKDVSVANLRNMLHEMIERPTVLSRRRYLERWKPADGSMLMIANSGFESFGFVRPSMDPGDDHVDPARIAADVGQLEAQTEKVRTFIEQTVAHRQRSTPEPVSFAQFNETIAAIERVFNKYYALVTQSTIAQVEPVAQFNTTEVFTFPWLALGASLEVED